MKCAILFVAVCAFAGAFGLPVSELKSSASVYSGEIDNLLESEGDVLRKIKDAKTETELDSVLKEIEDIDGGLQSTFEEQGSSQNGPPNEASEGEELSMREILLERIAEIRQAIVSSTRELASIVWQQARTHGGELSEQLAIARAAVVEHLVELKDELLIKIREAMIPDDDVPVSYVIDEAFEQIIAGLKAQVADALAVLSDWHNLLSESGKEKLAAAKEKLIELTRKIADTIREWRESEATTPAPESSNYMIDPFHRDDLMIMLKTLLEDLQGRVQLNMFEVAESDGESEPGILVYLQEIDAQLETSIESINRIIAEITGVDVSVTNPIAQLKNLLNLRMQQLQELIKNDAGSQEIEMVELEIMNLRRRILEALQDVFPKP